MDLDLGRPLDVGCGTLVPVRRSALAAIYSYQFQSGCGPNGAEDKQFEYDCIVVTTRGRWQFHGNDARTEIDAASLMLGAAGDAYSCRHDAAQGDSNYVVCLDPGAIDDEGRPLFSKQVVPARDAVRLVERALRSSGDDDFDSIVYALFDGASAASIDRVKSGRTTLRTQRVKRFLERHACERLRLADIAAEVGVSPFTCQRQFKHETGRTPLGYLSELRLERAKAVLAGSSLPIDAVARSVGFDDAAYFAKFFRRHTGSAPSAFRSKNRSIA